MSTPSALQQKQKHHHRAMWITLLIFVVIGLGCLGYWWFWARFYQYTNDSYVGGNKVIITPQVPGIVTSFSAISTDFVEQGRILIELDKTDANIALSRSIAELGDAVRQVEKMFEEVKIYAAEINRQKALFIRDAQDYERREVLVCDGGVSVEDFEHAKANLEAAYAGLVSTEHRYLVAVAQVENTSVYTHPLVVQAKDRVRDAYVFLQRCTIKAPVTGIVAQRSVQVGEHVNAAMPLMAIVPLDQMWIDANFKEIQLKKMRVGQMAKITADIYGDEVEYHGTVVGIGGGTGSVFSVLPPQNATGNWIKIVQRLPVKLIIPPEELKEHPLRLGLSMEVTVDIHDTDLPLIPMERPPEPLFSTDVFEDQEIGAEDLIASVIEANLSQEFIPASGER